MDNQSGTDANSENQKPLSDTMFEQQHEKLDIAVLKTWNKLTPQEIASRKVNPDQFFAAVQQKYGIDKSEAMETLNELKAQYGTASNSGSEDKSSPTTRVA